MKATLLFFLLLSAGTAAIAQVPGYQGLRFSVNYDAGLMATQIMGRPGTLPMYYNNVSVDYVITRGMSIGLKYGFMTYKAPPAKVDVEDAPEDALNGFKGKYTQNTISFIVKKFYSGKGYLAPVGRYFTFGAYYQYAVDRNFGVSQTSDIYGNPTYSPYEYKGTANYGGLILGMGRNFIVANRMILDFGFNINFPPFYLARSGEWEVVYKDIIWRNFFQVYIGLGALAF